MSDLIPKHGGYRKLKGFQVAQLVYDLTVRFCEKYVDRFSRTKDQMVQAARSGVQNIAEGSQASATSKKTELKLTQVARASLEELKLDYEDFLRQRELEKLTPEHPVLMRFKARKPQTMDEVRAWVAEEHRRSLDTHGRTKTHTDALQKEKKSMPVGEGPCSSPISSACLAANAALSLLNLACYLLDRQVERLVQDFENEGGFTERLYRVRSEKRRN
ncbi:MAG: four helix bundle suffix domain-containing protein [Victivallaceae bacterium]|nr:four helix bundle suffix domain-containing protein [Victivallaceae bacterium]